MMAVPVTLGDTFDFGRPQMLFESDHLRSVQPPSYDVAGDGRFLMLSSENQSEAGPPQITVVLNWHEELKARVPIN